MAIITGNLFLAGLSGRVKNAVYKQYGEKIVVCSVPNMKNRVLSEKQLESTRLMKQAIAFARNIIENPQQKQSACERLQVPPNKVFRAIVSAFMTGKGETQIRNKLSAIKPAE